MAEGMKTESTDEDRRQVAVESGLFGILPRIPRALKCIDWSNAVNVTRARICFYSSLYGILWCLHADYREADIAHLLGK